MAVNKKPLSERELCDQVVTPALADAGWDGEIQIGREVRLTAGRVLVRGRMASRRPYRQADYVLYYKENLPLAVVEAKDNEHSVGSGMQQALDYGEMLDVPFVYSTNGDAFLEHDRTAQSSDTVEREIPLGAFPSPDELWRRYRAWRGLGDETLPTVTQDYYSDPARRLRYYQVNAVNAVVEAVARGDRRALLVMATGTGKTLVAFQTIWRLRKAGLAKRTLFLIDRNALADQTRNNDFRPFGGVMTKVTQRKADKSYEVYLALYQAISGVEEVKNVYKQFSPGFFDLVVIDECHRGSADEASAWREILDYFQSAVHVGLTATPRETRDVSNIAYFGEPVYTYSLRQGIEDGYLAPYKVIRLDFDRDLEGWRPEAGKLDKYGREIEDRVYNQRDFDRQLVLDQRTQLVAKKVTEYLRATNRFDKTIVFCEDIDHAERMRQALVNENIELAATDRRYVMRMTGDNAEGKAEVETFCTPEELYPVVVTTSRLLATGVDTQTVKLIVLDRRIESTTEFKQIIGRGTRIREEYSKLFFTIMDFKRATDRFADPDFDGDPISIYDPRPGDPIEPPEDRERQRYRVEDVTVDVVSERTQYLDGKGRLITETLRDYTRKTVRQEFGSLDEFLRRWSAAERKKAIVEELEDHGVVFEDLAIEVDRNCGPFDIICHVAFDQPPLTRRERAESVRKRSYFTRYGDAARAVLEALLDKYADEGVEDLDSMQVLKLRPLNELGTPHEIVERFGGKEGYQDAVKSLQDALFDVA